MSKDHFKAYYLALKIIERDLKLKDFAILVGLSKRHAIRKVQRIREIDYLGAINGNTGNIPINKTSSELETKVIHLLQTKYYGFNLTHFREMLLQADNIEIEKHTPEMGQKAWSSKVQDDQLRN